MPLQVFTAKVVSRKFVVIVGITLSELVEYVLTCWTEKS